MQSANFAKRLARTAILTCATWVHQPCYERNKTKLTGSRAASSECSTKSNGPPQTFVYFTAFYDCDLTTLIGLVPFPAEPSFLLRTKNGKTHMSCHSIFSE